MDRNTLLRRWLAACELIQAQDALRLKGFLGCVAEIDQFRVRLAERDYEDATAAVRR